MASGVTVAVVGATGAMGQTTLQLLEERQFPVKALRVFASARSVGKIVPFHGEAIRLEPLGPDAFKGIELALFSAGSAQSKAFAPLAVQAGAVVVDKSSAFRMDPTVPLVVPEINAHALRDHRGIVACPNCTTIITVMPLKPLHDVSRLQRVVATSYQAVSGAGGNGIAELRHQTQAWARGEALTPQHFPHQIGTQDPGTARPRDFANHGTRPGLHDPFHCYQCGDGAARESHPRPRGLCAVSRAAGLGRSGAKPLPTDTRFRDIVVSCGLRRAAQQQLADGRGDSGDSLHNSPCISRVVQI